MNSKPRIKGSVSNFKDACKIASLIWNMQNSLSSDSNLLVHVYKVVK